MNIVEANNLFEDMVTKLLPIITKDLDDIPNVLIELEVVNDSDLDGSSDMEAATLHLGYEELIGLNVFEIECKKSLLQDIESFMTMVAHELVHVMQHLRGDEFDYSLPYDKQLHEIEAYSKEKELVAYYAKNINNEV